MWRRAVAISSLARAGFLAGAMMGSLALAGCASRPPPPASAAGACDLFEDPRRIVRGATPADQRWISATHEAGIAGCGWERPAADAPGA